MRKISGILSGVSGEYFVAAELSRRGYIATLTSKNTKGIDLLASNFDASIVVGIQVKTNGGSRKAWLLTKESEDFTSDNLFYIFVNLNGIDKPDFYIVPGNIVSDRVRTSHQKWLQTPAKNGANHNDTSMRMFYDRITENGESEFLNRWELLGLD